MVDRIFLCATGSAIGAVKANPLNRMQQNKGIQGIGNDFDQGVMGHEKGISVKCLSVVVFEQLKITQQVHDQKQHQENSGQGHRHLLSD